MITIESKVEQLHRIVRQQSEWIAALQTRVADLEKAEDKRSLWDGS